MIKVDKNKYPISFYIVSSVGCSVIVVLAICATYLLWQAGVKEQIYTSTMTTSVFFTSGLDSLGASTPWALLSLNWFACRSMIHKYRNFVISKLGVLK